MSNQINLSPIAFVRSKFETNTPAEEMRLETSQIVVEPEFAAGLLGLEPGTDLLVIFHFHRIEPDEIELQLHPRHNPANPRRGVFATRSQFRPNRLGLTVAHIEAVAGNVITVSGLDAQDGTPVLDLKPFVPYFDAATAQQQFEVREVNSLAEARSTPRSSGCWATGPVLCARSFVSSKRPRMSAPRPATPNCCGAGGSWPRSPASIPT